MGTILDYHILDTGYCRASESHILQGGARKQVKIHSLVGLLNHSEEGWLLFDTGYAPRMSVETKPWPYWLYRLATPFVTPPELTAAEQLKCFNLDVNDIRQIIVSHFHPDHVAGLLDFPNARFVCSQVAYGDIVSRKGFNALRKAYIPSLVPVDFTTRASLIGPFSGATLSGLGQTHDLFGDGSLLLMQLPGHARGQIGALAQTTDGPILFAADGAWYRQAIRERRPPARLAGLFVDDMAAVRETLDKLHTFAEARPEVTIVPTHCPEAYQQYCQ